MGRCPMCGGEGILLGALRALRWFRCRACGIEWSKRFRNRVRPLWK